MALLNKLGEIVKSAAEKTEELTKTLGEKAEAALEIQRLNSQVNKERSKISDTHKKIGEILWAKFEAGEEIPEEFKEHCTAISEALTKIDEHKVAIAKIKATAKRIARFTILATRNGRITPSPRSTPSVAILIPIKMKK